MMECEPEEWEMIELEKLISRERNPEIKEALEDWMNSSAIKKYQSL